MAPAHGSLEHVPHRSAHAGPVEEQHVKGRLRIVVGNSHRDGCRGGHQVHRRPAGVHVRQLRVLDVTIGALGVVHDELEVAARCGALHLVGLQHLLLQRAQLCHRAAHDGHPLARFELRPQAAVPPGLALSPLLHGTLHHLDALAHPRHGRPRVLQQLDGRLRAQRHQHLPAAVREEGVARHYHLGPAHQRLKGLKVLQVAVPLRGAGAQRREDGLNLVQHHQVVGLRVEVHVAVQRFHLGEHLVAAGVRQGELGGHVALLVQAHVFLRLGVPAAACIGIVVAPGVQVRAESQALLVELARHGPGKGAPSGHVEGGDHRLRQLTEQYRLARAHGAEQHHGAVLEGGKVVEACSLARAVQELVVELGVPVLVEHRNHAAAVQSRDLRHQAMHVALGQVLGLHREQRRALAGADPRIVALGAVRLGPRQQGAHVPAVKGTGLPQARKPCLRLF